MMHSIVFLVASTLVTTCQGAVRTVEQRVIAGECASESAKDSELFPINYLKSYASLGSTSLVQIDSPIQAAQLIEINYGKSFKVVTAKHAKEQYVLVQCGASQPASDTVNAVKTLPNGFKRKFFNIPLQRVIAESTVQLGFLDALGLHDRVSYASKYAVGSCWQSAISCGGVVNASIKDKQREAVDAVFMDCPWPQDSKGNYYENCPALHSIPKAIHFSASQEPAPMHSTEYIKFMAAFFNKEAAAESFFKKSLATMQAFKQQSGAVKDADKPVVAWIQVSWDGKAQISTPAFKKKMTEQAGAKMVDAAAVKTALGAKMTNAYVSQDKAAFLKALADNGVTAIIDETYSSDVAAYNFEKFLTSFGLQESSTLPFIKNKMVIREDSDFSGTSNLDWFEARLVNPHRTIEGLQRVLNIGDSTKAAFIFRNIAKGEAPKAINKNACSKTLAACNPSASPMVLPMITTLGRVAAGCDPGDVACGATRVGRLLAIALAAFASVAFIQ